MTAAELAAVLTAAAGLVGAIAALVHSLRTRQLVSSSSPLRTGPTSRSAKPGPRDANGAH